MKLVVALCLLNVGLADDAVVQRLENSARSFCLCERGTYEELCADPVTINSTPFPAIQDGTCYVVDGTFARAPQPFKTITVPEGVKRAKIAVLSDSTLGGIDAYSRVLFAPRPAKR